MPDGVRQDGAVSGVGENRDVMAPRRQRLRQVGHRALGATLFMELRDNERDPQSGLARFSLWDDATLIEQAIPTAALPTLAGLAGPRG